MKKTAIAMTLALFSVYQPVFAHTGISAEHTLFSGFVHPWQGIDHILVMFGLGFWAYLQDKKACWQLPVTFLIAMLIGAGLGFAGFSMSFNESWLAVSVIVFGGMTFFNWQLSHYLAYGLVILFAISHGFAHAAEIPPAADYVSYVLGFLFSTALLHGLGLVAGSLNKRTEDLLRLNFGSLCTLTGFLLLAGI